LAHQLNELLKLELALPGGKLTINLHRHMLGELREVFTNLLLVPARRGLAVVRSKYERRLSRLKQDGG
jgi:hypothetical protein